MSFGWNYFGQLGLGDYIDRLVPSLVPNLTNVFDISLGKYDSFFLISKYLLKEILETKIMFYFYLTNNILNKGNGTVMNVGYNYDGELGLGFLSNNSGIPFSSPSGINTISLVPNLLNVISISAGALHTLFLLSK